MENNTKFKPTTEWMEIWYNKMNQELFNGELGSCVLRPFTTGKGSRGGTLGWFKILNKTKCDIDTRKMYIPSYYGAELVKYDNFVKLCNPCIELNGNYSGTEDSWLDVLVHEMCHYYTYMRGIAPKQGHGVEFRQIGSIISARSNGRFTIQRIASAETMKGLDLDASIAQANQERRDRKASKMFCVAIILNDDVRDPHRYLQASNNAVVSKVMGVHNIRQDAKFIGVCKDHDLMAKLIARHRKSMRSYRYWDFDDELTNLFLQYNWTYYMGSCNTLEEALGKTQRPKPQEGQNEYLGYRIIKDGDGYNLLDLSTNMKTFGKPTTSLSFDSNINAFRCQMGRFKYVGTPRNWKKEGTVDESRTLDYSSLHYIIHEAVNKIVNGDEQEYMEITPDMNLGEYSPFEYNLMK